MDIIDSKYWEKTLSWVEGCTPISEACDNCWLAEVSYRFPKAQQSEFAITCKTTGQSPRFTGKVSTRPDRLDIPLKRKKPTVYAIWSDLFHEHVSTRFIDDAFSNMYKCYSHTFLLLTKRPERMALYCEDVLNEPLDRGNVYYGVTAENQEQADKRISTLVQTEVAMKKFISVEPILEPINLKLSFGDIHKTYFGLAMPPNPINCVIVGAESGHNRRECKTEWIRSIVEQCKTAGVPVFVKQLHINGKLVKDINRFPEDLQIRQIPWRK